MPTFTKKTPFRPFRLSEYKYKKRSVAKKANTALKLARKLNRAVEKKYLNWQTVATSTTAGAIIHVTQIAQGDTSSTRDGNVCTLKSIRMKGVLSGLDDLAMVARVIIFQDLQQRPDTTPSVTDILLTADVYSCYNYPNSVKRFKVYYDKTWTINPEIAYNGTTVVGNQHTIPIDKWIFPQKGKSQIYFNGANNSDQQKNNFYYLFIGSDTNVSPLLNFQLCFTDM